MDFELTASMMCANYGNLEKEVKELAEGGIDSFHIDIMDGRYVPNFAMSLNDMRYIAGAPGRALDDRAPQQLYQPVFARPAQGGYGVHSPGGGIPPLHYPAEDHQRRDDSRYCHQPRHLCGDGDGDAAHREKGAGDVSEPGKRRADVSALCGEEDYEASGTEGGHGFRDLLGRCLRRGQDPGVCAKRGEGVRPGDDSTVWQGQALWGDLAEYSGAEILGLK